MQKHLLFWFILLSLLPWNGRGQSRNEAMSVPWIQGSMGAFLPAGDLSGRFGPLASAGPAFMYKTRSNWVFGLEGDFLFGNDVREVHLFDAISTEQGYIIDAGGLYADVFTSMRGFRIGARGGYILSLSEKNKNSGLMMTLGAGLLQHKIRIDNKGNRAPQLDEDYVKGYDRLSNGLSLTASAGYLHLSSRRIANFYTGLEFTTAFAKSRRDWDFDRMAKDEAKRTDILIGLKAAWMIPLYGASKQKTYYY
ncbi:MAG: hypothetical protein KA053_03390 [Lentimicrobiaceae bacterium]|nr:hypothetical protein [Lentimicrobiaceae bacterium]